MRFAVSLLLALALLSPLDLAMNVTISNDQVFINNAQTFLGYATPTGSGCTQVYQCAGLLCAITQIACAVPVPSNSGQCVGILCGVTYP